MVSVCIATYNGEKFIEKQINSILGQLKEGDEIIISDNYSTDKTIDLINSINDKRIKIFFQPQLSLNPAKNCIKNFENALFNASGDYIFLSDQDDIWTNDKVSETLYYFNKYDIVVSDCKIINEDDIIILNSYFSRRNSGKGFLKNLTKNTYLGCCMAFKKEILKMVLPFNRNIPMHDIYIGFVAELFFKPIFIQKSLVYYRSHQGNVSDTTIGKSSLTFWLQLMNRVILIGMIPQLIYRKYCK